ncbi:hypothetical protein EI94DRAFT_1799085 [Lactarius quietus]|nr:hypothetical protein EI94DRAFT_1799085 [Lactarius quietus]
MPKKAAEELTQDEIKLLVSAAKVMAVLWVCMENPPSPNQQWYWDDNICEELKYVDVVYNTARAPHCHPILQLTGNRWGTAEKAGMPPNWTGLTLEMVIQSCNLQASKAPTWHQDLFAHDLTPYLQDIPPKKQWWNFPPPPAAPDDDVNMEESPSPAPPSPHIPPASQKRAVKGKAQAAPPPPPPDEYDPPQIHRTRSRKCSTVLLDLDGPADTPSKAEMDKDTPTHPVLPQGLLCVDVEGPSPPRAAKAPRKESMKAYGDDRCGTCKEKGFHLCESQTSGKCITTACTFCAEWKLPCAPPPLWARSVYEVANTHAPNEPLEYRGIPECLKSLEHEIAQSKWLLLAICTKLSVDVSTIPGYDDPSSIIPPPSPSNQSGSSHGLGVSSLALSETHSVESFQSSTRSGRPVCIVQAAKGKVSLQVLHRLGHFEHLGHPTVQGHHVHLRGVEHRSHKWTFFEM